MHHKLRTALRSIGLVLAVLFAVLLPYDGLYSTVVIYPLILVALLSVSKTNLRAIPRQAWVFMIVFLLSVVGYTYSSDTWRAGYLLERQLTIFIFPLVLPLAIDIHKKNISVILLFFTLSCIGAVLYLFYESYVFFVSHHLDMHDLTDRIFYNHSFAKPIGTHAGYLSLYLALSLFFLLYRFGSVNVFTKLLCLIGVLILCAGLFFLASRNTIITSIIIGIFILPFYSVRNKILIFGFIIAGCALFYVAAQKSGYIYTRFSKELVDDIKSDSAHYSLENPEPRIMRWQCAWELIRKKPVIGYGSGDEIGLLKEQYLKRRMMVSYSEEFNTHNQYLAMLLKNGVVGLMIFLGMLVYFFRLAIRHKDFVYLAFLLLISAGMLTENLIDANKGIFFFAFFNTLLGYRLLYLSKEHHLKPEIQPNIT